MSHTPQTTGSDVLGACRRERRQEFYQLEKVLAVVANVAEVIELVAAVDGGASACERCVFLDQLHTVQITGHATSVALVAVDVHADVDPAAGVGEIRVDGDVLTTLIEHDGRSLFLHALWRDEEIAVVRFTQRPRGFVLRELTHLGRGGVLTETGNHHLADSLEDALVLGAVLFDEQADGVAHLSAEFLGNEQLREDAADVLQNKM